MKTTSQSHKKRKDPVFGFTHSSENAWIRVYNLDVIVHLILTFISYFCLIYVCIAFLFHFADQFISTKFSIRFYIQSFV